MKPFKYFIITIIFFAINSCSPTYYPSLANVGMHSDAGEFKSNIKINASSVNTAVNYALTKNLLIGGSAQYFTQRFELKTNNKNKPFIRESNGYNFEIAPGFFFNYGKESVFEIAAGYGYGFVDSEDALGNYHKAFIQPSIGLTSEKGDVSFTPRFTTVFFDHSILKNKTLGNRTTHFFEPIATIRGGSKHVRFIFQSGFSIPLNYNPSDFEVHYWHWDIGLQYIFNTRKKH